MLRHEVCHPADLVDGVEVGLFEVDVCHAVEPVGALQIPAVLGFDSQAADQLVEGDCAVAISNKLGNEGVPRADDDRRLFLSGAL